MSTHFILLTISKCDTHGEWTNKRPNDVCYLFTDKFQRFRMDVHANKTVWNGFIKPVMIRTVYDAKIIKKNSIFFPPGHHHLIHICFVEIPFAGKWIFYYIQTDLFSSVQTQTAFFLKRKHSNVCDSILMCIFSLGRFANENRQTIWNSFLSILCVCVCANEFFFLFLALSTAVAAWRHFNLFGFV